ncbi:hypothetical protein DOT_2782 [Desulfosporosinus sp. OT]|nr:hypothetical protein DOT_2782 [Desulfosporosinus sp. OT]
MSFVGAIRKAVNERTQTRQEKDRALQEKDQALQENEDLQKTVEDQSGIIRKGGAF